MESNNLKQVNLVPLSSQEEGKLDSYLNAATTPLGLPYNFPRQQGQQDHQGDLSVDLAPDVYYLLKNGIEKFKVDFQTLSLAAFQVLLYRYSYQESFFTSVSLPSKEELGFFYTFIVESTFTSDTSLLSIVENVHAALLKATPNSFLSTSLREKLKQEKYKLHPFNQVLFCYQHKQGLLVQNYLPSSSIDTVIKDQHELNFCFKDYGSYAQLEVIYQGKLFKESTIKRMLQHYECMLGAFINPNTSIGELDMLSPSEKHQLLVTWNDTQKEYPSHTTIHQLFEEQAKRVSKQTAVIFKGSSLTYGELNEKSNQLAHLLREKGVKPDTLVVIACNRSVDMVIGILAILKAGGAYVPIDPSYPKERIQFIVEDTKAPLLLTQQELEWNFLKATTGIVFLDKFDKGKGKFKKYPKTNLSHITQSHHLAYVMYTSGSTGRPKGVMIQHKSISRLVFSQSYINIDSSSVIAQAANMSFDAATFEIWGALLQGAKLVILSNDAIFSVPEFEICIKKYGVNVLWLTKSLFDKFFDEDPLLFKNLRYLLIGGEALDPVRVRRIVKDKGVKELINGYGPTESTTFAICCNLSLYASLSEHIPLGRPISNTSVYILDPNLNLLPIGVIGELYIGGEGLARGYLNNPELTEEKFISNSFQTEEERKERRNARLYKTGDLCRWLEDGNIEYIGRIDDQVKLRGFRIELGEIELSLKEYPEIKDAIVIMREDTPGDKRLVAYLIFQHAPIEAKVIRTFLKGKLPEYMIPAAFIAVDHFPLTPNGKIDKKNLVPPLYQYNETYVAPITEIERALANIWEDVLKINKISIDTDFFALGGNSLLAASIIARSNKFFHVKLTIGDALKYTTIAALANKIESLPKMKLKLQKPATFAENKVNIPLTPSQEQIWFHLQEAQGEIIYNEPFTITMPMAINHEWLEKSINELIKRHEIFRVNISLSKGIPVQNILPYSLLILRFIDLSTIEEEARCFAEAYRIATLEARKPFNLEKDPLIRFTLIKLKANLYKLFIVVHHIIIDGVSLYKVFLPELVSLYKAFSTNTLPYLPKIDVQYSDYAWWEHSRTKDEAKHKHFWQQDLQGAQDISFGKVPIGFKGSRETLAFSKDLSQGLIHLSHQYSVSRFIILLTVLNTLLYKLTSQTDLSIVSVVAGRNHGFMNNMVGNFLNTVILRNRIFEDFTFADFLSKVNEHILKVYEHQELPLQQVAALFRNRNNDKLPFTVALVMEPALEQNEFNWELSQLEIHTDTAKLPLTIELDERPEGIIGRVEYNTSLFSQSFIKQFICYFERILQTIVVQPDISISAVDILSKEEKQKVLIEWNDTQKEYPSNTTMHQLFEEQAQRTPKQTAVVFEGASLTYGELNEKSNQLAHLLRERGVKPDTLVAVACDRSFDMIIGMLAILKAGGAYVPLDPDYPADRLTYMIANTQASIILTQSHLRDWSLLPKVKAETILLNHTTLFKDYPISNPVCITESHHLAYVIYTSGSTGKPKGVMVEHKSICDRLLWWQDYISLTCQDRFLHQFSFSFDGAIASLWWPLLNGCTVVLPTYQGLSDREYLINLIKQNRITALLSTPSMMDIVLDQPEIQAIDHIQKLMLAGETFTKSIFEKAGKIKECQIYNFYGPTESTIIATSYEAIDKHIATPTVPIGRPVANTQVYILDSALHPIPVGVVGELYIGGEGLARGYLNQPELTAERFINNHFATEEDKKAGKNLRLYKTGDLCRWLEDGNIEYIGRMDDQVKLRGFRIELGEIELALKQHPEIKDAMVIMREDTPGDKRIVAYIIFQHDPIASKVLRSFLKNRLPEYMTPTAFVAIGHFPLTPNGKIDKNHFPAPLYQGYTAHVEPRTEEERVLAQLIKDILKIEAVGIHDNFLDLGLTSLNIFQFITLAHKRGINISIQQLYTFDTIAKLAHSITHKLEGKRLVYIRRKAEVKDCIVLIPGAGGSIATFNRLIKKLDHPMIAAIQPVDEDLAETSIQQLAEKCANSLLTEMSHIRYTLVGYSFGAILAYEIAQLLKDHQLSGVLMLDTSPLISNYYNITGDLNLHALCMFATIHKGLSADHLHQFLNELAKLGDDEKIEYVRKAMKYRFTVDQIAYFRNFYIANMKQVQTYKYSFNQRNAKFIFIRAQDRSLFKTNSHALLSLVEKGEIPFDDGLSAVIDSLQVVSVPGNHVTMLDTPYVENLAKIIQTYVGFAE